MSTGPIRLASIPLICVTAWLLAACGAEVASTAATVGALQATQAEQAQGQQRQIESDLGKALKAGQSRAATAGAQ